jgi:hypothetical protein
MEDEDRRDVQESQGQILLILRELMQVQGEHYFS